MKSWTQTQIKNHEIAAKKLGLIKDEVATFISNESRNVYEVDVINFIKSLYRKHGLINDDKKQFAICAFDVNTSNIHYFPKGKGLKLKQNTLILVDIWARLNKKSTPYADMTWMFWFGKKVPVRINKCWGVLSKSRDESIKYLKKVTSKNKMPRGLDVDRIAFDYIGESGYMESIRPAGGHSLGFESPHGNLPGIFWREYRTIYKNVGITIEPGMYFKDKFGLRTEIDFYVNNNNEVIITTPLQKFIEIIK